MSQKERRFLAMRTVRIIVSGEDCSRIMVTNERTKKGFLSFLSEKKKSSAMCGKDNRKR
jgi:hypothetical protein